MKALTLPCTAGALRLAVLGAIPAALLALSPLPAEAQTHLRFATGQAPDSVIQQRAYGAWADSVNEASNGLLDITSYPPPFAVATNIWDRVTAGVADMGIASLGTSGLDISAAYLPSLPGLGGDSEAASAAMWRLYERGLLDEGLDEVKVLGFQVVMPLSLYSKTPITSMADLEGLRVRVTDHTTSSALTQLGASPSAIPFNEAYQAISRGVVDAALGNGNTMVVFRFRELLSHQVADMSFGATPFAIIMNHDAYNALGDEEREALDSLSGEHLSRFLGSVQNDMRTEFDEDLVGSGDLTVNTLSEEEMARWTEALAPVIDAWVSATPDGQMLLDEYIAAYEDVVAGN
ncbi:TRAP transporter substrate-binding protein DctP [Pararhodobacter sp.]|uniref:TRAP transporter substrate-binding protein DctP n=1 Tax=Pararhodobacter sp. TaxID=2127056 RepID=UPI002FDE8042